MTNTIDVVVIGGGFGGLFLATELSRRGHDVLLLEASANPGGVARTIIEDGFILEPAAGTFMLPHRSLTPLLATADVSVEEAYPAAALRYVWMKNSLVGIPYGPKALLTSALSMRGKLRMAGEPLVRASRGDGSVESLQAFLTRRLGREAGGLLSHLAASGVYAGNPEEISATASFPLFTELESDAGSIVRGAIRRLRSTPKPRPPKPQSHLPVGGMSGAAKTLAAWLGEQYRGEFPVSSVTKNGDRFRIEGPETFHARSVVLALRPDAAATILPDINTDALHGWPSSPVVVVGVGGTATELPLPAGFGFLTGPDTDAATLGCLFESSYAPGRAAPGLSLAKVIAGGALKPSFINLDDEQILSTVVSEMERALGYSIAPSWSKIVRDSSGIPQYDLRHRDRLTAIDDIESRNPGLLFGGWAYRGIGVAHLSSDAVRIADRIRENLSTRPPEPEQNGEQ